MMWRSATTTACGNREIPRTDSHISTRALEERRRRTNRFDRYQPLHRRHGDTELNASRRRLRRLGVSKARGNTSRQRPHTLAFPWVFETPMVGRLCRPRRRVDVGACAPDLGAPVTPWFEISVSLSLRGKDSWRRSQCDPEEPVYRSATRRGTVRIPDGIGRMSSTSCKRNR